MRESGVDVPVLSWLNPVDVDVRTAVRYGIDLSVPSLDHLAAVEQAGPVRVHLHLDTGMARDGAAPDSWLSLMSAARRLELTGKVSVVGVMGHLPCADMPGANEAGKQALLRGVEMARQTGLSPSVRHLAATSAALTDPGTHLDVVRIGAGLVGIDPSGTIRLRSALRFTAPVVQVRRSPRHRGRVRTRVRHRPCDDVGVAAGGLRGRLAAHRVRAGGGVAGGTTPAGRRDDLDGPGRGGRRGRRGDAGDEAVVFGPGDDGEPTVEQWARWAGTIPHEIVTGIGARVRRRVR